MASQDGFHDVMHTSPIGSKKRAQFAMKRSYKRHKKKEESAFFAQSIDTQSSGKAAVLLTHDGFVQYSRCVTGRLQETNRRSVSVRLLSLLVVLFAVEVDHLKLKVCIVVTQAKKKN